MFIKAHIYQTQAEAQTAIDMVNQGEGIPFNENATTLTYMPIQQYENIYYIAADEVTEKYLGEADFLEIIQTEYSDFETEEQQIEEIFDFFL